MYDHVSRAIIVHCVSHGTTAAALQGIPSVTTTNGVSVLSLVRVCAHVRPPEDILEASHQHFI